MASSRAEEIDKSFHDKGHRMSMSLYYQHYRDDSLWLVTARGFDENTWWAELQACYLDEGVVRRNYDGEIRKVSQRRGWEHGHYNVYKAGT